MEGATILHVDLDAFYASVEERRDPTLHGKPFVVGGGVVLSPSYEARRFGVTSGMGIRRARELCPRLVVVKGTFSNYSEASDQVFDLCRRYTPLVEQMSIDEAFLDVSGAEHLFGPAPAIAAELKRTVLEEVSLTVSIGVARTKFLAKVASRVAKPNGIVVVPPDRETGFLRPLPVDALWGIGPKTRDKLAEYGVVTVGDLSDMPRSTIAGRLGRGLGPHLQALAANDDPRRVQTKRRAKSIGSQSAFGGSIRDTEVWDKILLGIADRVTRRLRDKELAGQTITVRVRFDDLQSVTRSRTLSAPLATTDGVYLVARELVDIAVAEASERRGLSLLAISISKLQPGTPQQLELDLGLPDELIRPGTPASQRRYDLDRAIDELRARFGRETVGAASVLLDPDRDRLVPEEFRELAQFKE